jgi:hypothetical protein
MNIEKVQCETADLEICATRAWMSRRSGLADRRCGVILASTRTQSNFDPALLRPNPGYSGLIRPMTKKILGIK